MMKDTEAKALLKKYKAGNCTDEEKARLESWYLQWNNEEQEFSEALLLQVKDEMWSVMPKQKPVQRRLWPKIAVAAAAMAAVVFGVWLFNSKHEGSSKYPVSSIQTGDIAPGKNGATITLGNGKVIRLSDSKTGVVVGEGLKYSDGSDVRYSSGSQFSGSQKGSQKTTGPVGVSSLATVELQGADGKVQNLTAQTSRGQTYQFTLPDGTKVWLNAESKIEFPSSFMNSNIRNVKLTGEGYFEVEKDKAHPFIVKTTTQEVTVLGTHFNISSYSDDHVTTTTLLEGSVKLSAFDVIAGKSNAILKPNQQAIQNPRGGMQVRDVDVAEAVDWKNGEFVFANEPLTSILKRVARWYDVDIVYERETPTATFTGSVSRFDNASAILSMLEKTGDIQFEIKGKKIIVK